MQKNSFNLQTYTQFCHNEISLSYHEGSNSHFFLIPHATPRGEVCGDSFLLLTFAA